MHYTFPWPEEGNHTHFFKEVKLNIKDIWNVVQKEKVKLKNCKEHFKSSSTFSTAVT